MATREHVWWNIFSSRDTYDPDRLAFDQQKLRQFYLTQGYADFRVVSAVAELTPDRRDFIITYVVEEGERYKFGNVAVESDIRDFSAEQLRANLPMETGDWYNAQQVEDTVTRLNELAGLFGYAFADVRPQFQRNRENLTMGVTFRVAETPRVYVERIDISGNTTTRDKVIRREFRLAEGDPFNNVRVRRSRDRIQSLGYFQENLEIQQEQGSAPDRVVLGVEVEERATGELQLSAGFSSLERFLVNLSVRQRNFMGRGQELRASINYSSYSKSVELGFTEPYLFDRNIAVGFDLFRRDYNSFNFFGDERTTTYEQVTTGGQIRVGVPLTEQLSLALRYGLNYDEIGLNPAIYFTDPDGAGPLPAACDPLKAGRYLCDVLGNRLTSSIGYSLVWDTLNNRLRPSAGERFVISQDFAGLGGDVRYLRTRLSASKYWNIWQQLHLLDPGRGRLYPQLRGRRAGHRPGPPHRPLLPRQPADPRLRHSRRRPAHPARALSVRPGGRRHGQQRQPLHRSADDHRRRDRRPRLLHRPRRARDSAGRELPRARPQAVRLYRRRRAVGRAHAGPARHHSGQPAAHQPVHQQHHRRGDGPPGQRALHHRRDPDPRRRQPVPRVLPRRHAEPAPFGRLRRQLELAVRPVPHRYRARAPFRAGRRHQALQL